MRFIIVLFTSLIIPLKLIAQPIPLPIPENGNNGDEQTAEYLKNFSTYFNIDVENKLDLPVT